MSKVSFPALKCVQNEHIFYIAVMNSKDLEDMCFVSRRKDDANKGFQRLLSKKRANEIAKYLDSGKGVIPSALIVSAQSQAGLEFDEHTGCITLERIEDGLLVLDGQHRLYGMKNATNNYDIPVVIFANLTPQEEIRQFIDINTTQKGVPSALILDIKEPAGMETELDERQRILFQKLKENSVLSGFMADHESKTGRISKPAFYSATKSLFEGGPLSNATDAYIYAAVKNYLAAVVTIFRLSEKSEARITKNILFKAFMHLFNEVVDKCLVQYGNLKTESFVEYLEPLQYLEYEQYTGTNKATESRIINDIRNALRANLEFNGDMF